MRQLNIMQNATMLDEPLQDRVIHPVQQLGFSHRFASVALRNFFATAAGTAYAGTSHLQVVVSALLRKHQAAGEETEQLALRILGREYAKTNFYVKPEHATLSVQQLGSIRRKRNEPRLMKEVVDARNFIAGSVLAFFVV